MNFDLAPTETLIRKGPANMQCGWEAVGGWLFLTDRRLVFSPHGMNVQKELLEISLSSVQGIERCWAKLLGIVPILPNSLAVSGNERDHLFVVWGRSQWVDAIRAVTPQSSD